MPYLLINDRKIEYEWHGPSPSNAPTIIFLHEGLGCVTLWRDFPAQLAEATKCGAFVYSRFGYGLSDSIQIPRPVSFMHDEALNVLPKIVEAMKIDRPILLGHSDGGSIALIYSGSNFGKNVKGLVLEAPHVFVEEISIQSITAAGEEFLQGDLKKRLERHHGMNVETAFWGWNRVWLDPEFRSWNIEEFLPNIRKPVLVIQGKQDNFGTPKQVEAISAKCPGPVQTVLLPACGHTPHRDQPQLTMDSIVNFIKALLVSSR